MVFFCFYFFNFFCCDLCLSSFPTIKKRVNFIYTSYYLALDALGLLFFLFFFLFFVFFLLLLGFLLHMGHSIKCLLIILTKVVEFLIYIYISLKIWELSLISSLKGPWLPSLLPLTLFLSLPPSPLCLLQWLCSHISWTMSLPFSWGRWHQPWLLCVCVFFKLLLLFWKWKVAPAVVAWPWFSLFLSPLLL